MYISFYLGGWFAMAVIMTTILIAEKKYKENSIAVVVGTCSGMLWPIILVVIVVEILGSWLAKLITKIIKGGKNDSGISV